MLCVYQNMVLGCFILDSNDHSDTGWQYNMLLYG